jgi:hypothetical protein
VPLDGMAAAVRDGVLSFSFMDVPAFDRFAGVSITTFQQLSERTSIPLELLKVVREAVGFAEPGGPTTMSARPSSRRSWPSIKGNRNTGYPPP